MAPTLTDVATAIINITTNPHRDRFKPSQITDYLMKNGFSHCVRNNLSAQVTNKLKDIEYTHNKIIIRDPHAQQTRNVPWIIMERERLKELCDPETIQEHIDEIEDIEAPTDIDVLYQSIHKLEQRIETLEMNASNTQNGETVTKGLMELIINDRSEFEKHFCREHVIERLDDIPVWVYHEVLQAFFKIIKFKAASSPTLYTTHSEEMPLLKLGKLSGNQNKKMLSPSFGLTSHTQVKGESLKSGIYIWLSKQAYEQSIFELVDIMLDRCSWRGSDAYVLTTMPLATQMDHGWFIRTLGGDDNATWVLQQLKQFSITPPVDPNEFVPTPLYLNSDQ